LKSAASIIDGVGPSRQWLPAGPWETVIDFLKERFPRVAAATWDYRMAQGQVLDETGLRLHSESRYRAGACVFITVSSSRKNNSFAECVLYQDENILVVDKPHFLPVIPAGHFFMRRCWSVCVRKAPRNRLSLFIASTGKRLGGPVSLNPKTLGSYTSLFRERKVEKVYQALAFTNAELSFPLTRRSRIAPGEPFFSHERNSGRAQC